MTITSASHEAVQPSCYTACMQETQDIATYVNMVFSDAPLRLTISNPQRKDQEFSRATLRLLADGKYQAEERRGAQAFHKNMTPDEAQEYVCNLMESFKQLNAKGTTTIFELKLSKKGVPHISRHQIHADSHKNFKPTGNNREKRHLLQDGQLPPVFCDLGISTQDGKVKASKQGKYRQVCRFQEIIDDVLPTDCHGFDSEHPFEVVDFGCGKAYLTFGVYHYLHTLRGLPIHMSGLDLKADVIKRCSELAQAHGCEGLEFSVGNIAQWHGNSQPDLVIMLHACDTATDFGLAKAIGWQAHTILSVPCCQHQLAGQITSDDYTILTRYGIVKERTAALMTDAIRANLLTACGYKTQLLEFVDEGATAKNLLIRATKAPISVSVQRRAMEEVKTLCQEFSLQPELLTLLQDIGCLP